MASSISFRIWCSPQLMHKLNWTFVTLLFISDCDEQPKRTSVGGRSMERRCRRDDEGNEWSKLGFVGGMDGVGRGWYQRLLLAHQPLHLNKHFDPHILCWWLSLSLYVCLYVNNAHKSLPNLLQMVGWMCLLTWCRTLQPPFPSC